MTLRDCLLAPYVVFTVVVDVGLIWLTIVAAREYRAMVRAEKEAQDERDRRIT